MLIDWIGFLYFLLQFACNFITVSRSTICTFHTICNQLCFRQYKIAIEIAEKIEVMPAMRENENENAKKRKKELKTIMYY